MYAINWILVEIFAGVFLHMATFTTTQVLPENPSSAELVLDSSGRCSPEECGCSSQLTGESFNMDGRNGPTNFRYDPQTQAETLDDAIVNFPDLAALKFGISTDGDSQRPPPHSGGRHRCRNEACRACADILLNRLQQENMIPEDSIPQFRNRFGITGDEDRNRCTRLTAARGRHFPGQHEGDFGPPNGFPNRPPDMRSRSHERPGMGFFENSFHEFRSHFGEHFGRRNRRQASTNTEQIDAAKLLQMARNANAKTSGTSSGSASSLGTVKQADIGKRVVINCYKRGSIIEGSENCGLCNFCWVWRELPEGYEPRYVNELLCETDTVCLSKFGACVESPKAVTVFKKQVVNGVASFANYSLPIGHTCDCQIPDGSALQSFVRQ